MTTPGGEPIAEKVKRGAAWMVAARFSDSAIGMASTIILARLLVPEDFGLIALATSLEAMLSLLQAFGFESALIRNQASDRDQYDTAWTIALTASTGIAVLLALGAVPMARFYEDDRIVLVVLLVALAKFIEGFKNIGVVDFQKEFLFTREFLYRILRRIISFSVTVSLALAFRSYLALAIGILVGRATSVLLSYLLHPFRPRLGIAAWRQLYDFSKWNLINALSLALATRFGFFFIGKLASPAALGSFSIANEIAYLPSSELGAPINRAVYPGYARAEGDPGRLRGAYVRVLALVALVVVPVATGLASVADSIVPLLLGSAWLAAIPLIPVLAFAGLVNAITSNTAYVYLCVGRYHLPAVCLLVRVAILIPSLWLTLPIWGALGAACSYAASMAMEIPLNLYFMRREVGLRLADVGRAIWRPALSAAVMVLAVRGLSDAWSIPEGALEMIPRLAALVAAGAATYLAMVSILWGLSGRPPGAERLALDTLGSRWRRVASPGP